MVSTKSMKAAEMAAQAAGKNSEGGDVGLDGGLEDLTEIEGLRKVVETQVERQARVEEELNGLQVQARDHGRTLDALLAVVEALQGQVSSLMEAWKRSGAGAGDGGKPPEEGGAVEEGSVSVALVGGQGAERISAEGGRRRPTLADLLFRLRATSPSARQARMGFCLPHRHRRWRARGKAKMAEYVDPDLQAGLNWEELVDPEQEMDRGPCPTSSVGWGRMAEGRRAAWWAEPGGKVGRVEVGGRRVPDVRAAWVTQARKASSTSTVGPFPLLRFNGAPERNLGGRGRVIGGRGMS
ncbi:unnamed protein product [Linum trigynum]|uniref:Uncharacterized protein n=1 Tax=Linum trigynum TaxID=586398 RepID=A0AAV2F3T5_9ROSI